MITEKKKTWDRKGGRPKKTIKRDQQLAAMCALFERKIIESKAKKAGISVSEFLRDVGLKGQVVIYKKSFPKEILLFKGEVSHIAASLNQIARKKNRDEPFNALERATASNALYVTTEVMQGLKKCLKDDRENINGEIL